MQETNAIAEARRDLEICNACRYCEGYCAVFPAMEMRRAFTAADVGYLANLCHNCKGCFYACQYAPPHEFGINLPRVFTEVRRESYAAYAWPAPLARLFERNGLVVSLGVAGSIALVLILTMLARAPEVLFASHVGAGAFYRIIPWGFMTAVATLALGFAIVSLIMSGIAFWRDTGGGTAGAVGPLVDATGDILTLRNLSGGGHGCNDTSEAFTETRRWLHHAMFYGFALCFASTSVATVYDHYLGLIAPYAFFSLPVLLGTVGGVGMMVGTGGLAWLKVKGDQAPAPRAALGADMALLALLNLTALTGLLLLMLRSTGAMGVLLAVHLGVVLALFLLIPYSKMVHGLYRGLALLRNAIDKRNPAMVAAAAGD